MLFERAGGGEGMPTRATGMGVLVGGVAAAGGAAGSQRGGGCRVHTDSPVLLALASFHRRSWRRLFCRRLCGGGDCDGGGRDGLSAALQQREEQREANAVAAAVRTDSAVLLALDSLHRRSWRRLCCRRLCGRRRRL